MTAKSSGVSSPLARAFLRPTRFCSIPARSSTERGCAGFRRFGFFDFPLFGLAFPFFLDIRVDFRLKGDGELGEGKRRDGPDCVFQSFWSARLIHGTADRLRNKHSPPSGGMVQRQPRGVLLAAGDALLNKVHPLG